ncbi:polysaccharide deacetylase family protein [Ruminococcus sp. XPD3002]|uniref:polysaccharide deacetylase family protein n=1 Tax=Ruminococcus sp. XPD3002 TaxID=1452269 RepID=UPI000922F928|nr:Polysaccharide deacetylase [Ruminococcus flavefaciens]
MYRCCNIKYFCRLLVLDAVIFTVFAAAFAVGRIMIRVAAGERDEMSIRLPVIMYHSVCDKPPSEYVLTPQQLEDDLRYLRENGYTAVSAQQLVDYTRGRGELPEKSVMITLDDGFYNNLSEVLPLLEKYDMRAVVSVVGSYTDKDAPLDPHIPVYSYLTWEDVNELISSGRVEIGSHTYDMHGLGSSRRGCSIADGESEEDYRRALNSDLSQLQHEMYAHTGCVPFVFAYPFGAVSRESLPVIRENGFLMTLTCREKANTITRDPQCLFGIGRFNRSGMYTTAEYMRMIFEEE